MKFLRDSLDKVKPNFQKGGKWEKFYYIFEANETLLFAPDHTTGANETQIKDAIDMKRMMMTVIIALIPCLIFGIFNTGYQHFIAIGQPDASILDMLIVGAIQVLPIVAVSYIAGLGVEFTFATIRRHPINEGFLVSGMLIPLVMPPNLPLWQVALATVFAVIIAKEAFGGTGMNILNVALTARAFLYFAYPSDISGNVWTYIGEGNNVVAGFTGATPLSIGADAVASGANVVQSLNEYGAGWRDGLFSASNLFIGLYPDSIGASSVIMCLIGAVILIATGVGSWKIIVSVFAGGYITGLLFNALAVNAFMEMPAFYHLLIGGMAFGAVYMATDPVSAAQTEIGKWVYGLMIGILTVLIRVFNPAYPEGIMLAILFMNVFAPLIDYFVVNANKKRRLQRATV